MSTVVEPLVGRVAELAKLDRALAALALGATNALLISGEPGIGKTRFLAEVAGRAAGRGFTVLTASASELERDLPFWIFVDALDQHVAAIEPRRLASLGDDVLGELAQLLPALAEHRGAGGPIVRDERYRAPLALRELLERLAATRRLVLVLDDVHWADAASVDVLTALLRRPPAASVLLVLATRPLQVPERLTRALERADRDGALTQIALHGLDRDEAGRLLGDDVGSARGDALFEESGGNPFYLEQLARSPADGAPGPRFAESPALDGVGVPRAVVASLGEELDLLTAGTRRVLQGAAVAGDPFEPELAAAAAGVEESSAIAAFDELLALGLVCATGVPRRFRFRHPLVRRAVYEGAPAAWLLGAHERCAQVLAERGASTAKRAHHVEQSARHGDAGAIALLKDAGLRAMLRAPASGERWISAALRLLPEDAPSQERIDLLLPRAGALAALGRLSEAHADLLESIAVLAPSAGATRVRLVTACAGVEQLLGRHVDAHARLQSALDELPATASADAVALMLELAKDALFGRRWEEVGDWAGRALDGARELDSQPLIAACLAMLTLGRAMSGAIAEAEELRAQTSALIAAMSDDDLSERIDAAAFLAAAETYLDRYEDAFVHATRARALGRATGNTHPTLMSTLGTAHFMLGRLAEAAAVLDMSVEASRMSTVSRSVAWSLHTRSYVAWLSGDIAGGLALAEEAVQRATRVDESIVSAWTAVTLAVLSLPAGSSEDVVQRLLRSAGGEQLPSIPGGWRVMGLDVLARSLLALGRRDDAARVAADAHAQAAALGLPVAGAWAHRALAAVALHDGEPAEAAELALASARLAEGAGVRVEAALSRMLAGRALAEAGDGDAAAAQFELAAAVFEASGAGRHRDAAEQELRRIGRRVHRRSRPAAGGAGLESLTGRERQIAALIVDRRTNPEIAAELFLSTKTIESHLRNIFHKVGVSSRVELARLVERG